MEAFRARRLLISKWSVIQKYRIRSTVLTFTFLQSLWASEPLPLFDSIIRGALAKVLGSPLTDVQWSQASLPVAMGGLGLRSAADHAPVAHATSLLAAQHLLDGLLGEDEKEMSLPQPQCMMTIAFSLVQRSGFGSHHNYCDKISCFQL